MPGVHKDKTISFRPSSWERALIEERASMSGIPKKDFIARSCIYSNICVVGNKRNVQRIVDALEEVRNVMVEGAVALVESFNRAQPLFLYSFYKFFYYF